MSGPRNVAIAAGFLALLSIMYVGGGFIHDALDRGTEKPAVVTEPVSVTDARMAVRLAVAPNPTSADYFGVSVPYVLATITGPENLNVALLEATVEPRGLTGYDGCASRFLFQDFHIITPAGGANAKTTNVTYTSDGYSNVFEILPGGHHCAARFGVEGDWNVTVKAEMDGVHSEPTSRPDGSTVIDPWDLELHMAWHGKFP